MAGCRRFGEKYIHKSVLEVFYNCTSEVNLIISTKRVFD